MADYDAKMKELANEYNLQLIQTTKARNGFHNLKSALIGFETFEQAEKFAQEHGLDIWMFHKRDGWELWERVQSVYEPMSISREDYGDDYNMFKADELENYFEDNVKPCLEIFDNIDDLRDFLDEQEIIMRELGKLNDDEAVITYCGTYYETIKLHPMELKHDTHNYVIGVM